MLIGYSDVLSVPAGGRVEFKVSSDKPYELAVVRLVQGDDSAQGPEYREEDVAADCAGAYPGRIQSAEPGSYVLIDDCATAHPTAGLTLVAWVWPTVPAHGRQAVVTRWAEDGTGYGLEVMEGRAMFTVRLAGRASEVRSAVSLTPKWWQLLAAGIDAVSGRVFVWQASRDPAGRLTSARHTVREAPAIQLPNVAAAPLLIAAANDGTRIRAHFNGRIALPRWFSRPLTPGELASLDGETAPESLGAAQRGLWDLGPTQPSSAVLDVSGNDRHGTAFNNPARAIRGPLWDGSALSAAENPAHYSCMHFHEDDLADAGWTTDAVFDAPPNLRSAVYAARLRSADEEEYLPFVVRPSREATAPVCLILPTLTYLAYGNERGHSSPWLDFGQILERPVTLDARDLAIQRHREFGPSIYDPHSDGSYNMYASRLRPLLNIRPKVVSWLTGAGRHLVADLYLVSWLEHEDIAFDVVTDEDVHQDGAELLGRYKVVLTGAHPEYATEQIIDSLTGYLAGGGHVMYLGGNGFRWVATLDPSAAHIMEVRKDFGLNFVEGFSVAPGEEHHSQTGTRGGYWIARGRGSERWLGVGTSSVGWKRAQPYHRTEESHDPETAWIFEGVADEQFGAFGLALGGAAGDEMDCVSPLHGTPPRTIVLASSRDHGAGYGVVSDALGVNGDRLRADMTYLPYDGGGAAFSVGSMCWCTSLPHNGYDNDVARITRNVLMCFRDGPR